MASPIGLISSAVCQSWRASASTKRRTISPTPTVSAAAKTTRRRRSDGASARGADNEALGHPPDERADGEAERPAEDHRPDEGREVRMDGVARPEDDRRADDGGGGEGEGPVRLGNGAEAVERDD